MAKAVNVNANSVGSVAGGAVILTTQTLFSLYVVAVSGAHNNHRIGLEISPDGTVWMELPQSILGSGYLTVQHTAANIRPKIIEAEGGTSVVDIHLLAK